MPLRSGAEALERAANALDAPLRRLDGSPRPSGIALGLGELVLQPLALLAELGLAAVARLLRLALPCIVLRRPGRLDVAEDAERLETGRLRLLAPPTGRECRPRLLVACSAASTSSPPSSRTRSCSRRMSPFERRACTAASFWAACTNAFAVFRFQRAAWLSDQTMRDGLR
jgi:hypothetical protein